MSEIHFVMYPVGGVVCSGPLEMGGGVRWCTNGQVLNNGGRWGVGGKGYEQGSRCPCRW